MELRLHLNVMGLLFLFCFLDYFFIIKNKKEIAGFKAKYCPIGFSKLSWSCLTSNADGTGDRRNG